MEGVLPPVSIMPQIAQLSFERGRESEGKGYDKD